MIVSLESLKNLEVEMEKPNTNPSPSSEAVLLNGFARIDDVVVTPGLEVILSDHRLYRM